MNDHTDQIQRYAVEVSGWDAQEKFFVEGAKLEWNEQNRKKVVLRHSLKIGGMVFLRLLDPVKPPAILPVAYRAIGIQPAARGCCEVQLDQVWPERTETSGGIGDPAARRGIPAAGPTSGRASRPASRIESMIRESSVPSRRKIP